MSFQGEYKQQKWERNKTGIQKECQICSWVVVSPQIGSVEVLRFQWLLTLSIPHFQIWYKVEGWGHGWSSTATS
jgi:hypothetical protein